ncbi:MAG TPA: NADH-quinone oxidoreductase subunit L [Acidimicrobiales bacterium]
MENAWLIPVIPAVAFFVIIGFGKRLPMKGAEVGIASMLASLVLALGAAYQWIQHVDDAHSGSEGALASLGRAFSLQAETGHESAPFVAPVVKTWTWWQSGGDVFSLGTMIDGLSIVLLVVVSLITTLVLVYSVEYMRDDRRFTHFFASLVLFASGMLAMVSAVNTLQFLLGWEIMGLCSFMLIGHWWEDHANSRAALKAFLTVRTGDIGIIIGLSILFFGSHSWAKENLGTSGFDIPSIQAWAMSGTGSSTLLLMACLALLWATIGKSGQFPLHTWLPDAMAGPTPVSSLLHSSTMVVAGVFLVARFYPVFWSGLHIGDGGFNLVALVGGVTIVIAALLAFVQTDIKKVLAYSTVSQLGYMVMGLGVGAWTAAVFHIFTHAWFKALLFLAAGSVSHSGSHHSFDMKQSMGGLRKKMPITFATWVIGTLALCGIFPLAGFWSKDEILANAGHNGYTAFMVIGLCGAFMTAAYMTRATYLTFFGEYRGGQAHADAHDSEHHAEDAHDEHAEEPVLAAVGAHGVDSHDAHDAHGGGHGGGHGHDDHGGAPHESPKLITVPLVILAALACVSGFLLAPAKPFEIELFKKWVEPSSQIVPAAELASGEAGSATPGDGIRMLPAAETGGEGEGTGAEAGQETEAPAAGEVQIFPAVSHAPFEWPKALLSLGIALAGIVVAFALCRALYTQRRFVGLTQRNKLLGAGYAFLWNKYYLDDLYEKIIVPAFSTVFARFANWTNKYVLDGIVDSVGRGSAAGGRWVYRHVDQGVVDGAVNGAGRVSEGTGSALRSVQSGKVQQYGALLFAAAAIGALVLVIVV